MFIGSSLFIVASAVTLTACAAGPTRLSRDSETGHVTGMFVRGSEVSYVDADDFRVQVSASEDRVFSTGGHCGLPGAIRAAFSICTAAGNAVSDCRLTSMGGTALADEDSANLPALLLSYERDVAYRRLANLSSTQLSVDFVALPPVDGGWPDRMTGELSVDPFQRCTGPADARSPGVECQGFWNDGYNLVENEVYPRLGNVQLDCGELGVLHGEFLGVDRDAGVACLFDVSGNTFRIVYGPDIEGDEDRLALDRLFQATIPNVAGARGFCAAPEADTAA